MKAEKIFVFRISNGNSAGNPKGKCPLDYSKIFAKIQGITEKDIKRIDYENSNYIDFLRREFFENNVLRQGWGIADLDLNLDIHKWIENYIYNGKIFWDADIGCDQAKGRHNILIRMKKMKVGDVLIIPKTSFEYHRNYGSFIVCQVSSEYYFDLNQTVKDFGHCIGITNIMEFSYSKKNLERYDFRAPYLWAVTEVKKSHNRFQKFSDFINNQYFIR